MVLLVKGQVAAVVVRARSAGRRDRRSAAEADDLGPRREDHAAAARSERGAEVDVFFVEKKAFVEQTGIDEGVAAHEETRAADPVHLALVGEEALDSLSGGRRIGRGRADQSAL